MEKKHTDNNDDPIYSSGWWYEFYKCTIWKKGLKYRKTNVFIFSC